mmetsp:Transcript_16553/g.47123  ORF Transcript_16553/g.47123 Transcript_16553/m.47123 type:complete len:248 (+) Transcript_16553:1319-2062(+)
MIFVQSLSTLLNFLASIGSCLAMSPPVKTDSREHHMSWTLTHCSSVSAASFKLANSSAASSRNGATWRMVRKVCICMMLSSSSSVRMPVPCKVGIGLDFQSLNVNSRTSQMPLISFISCSIFNCLSAPSVISSTSSATFSNLREMMNSNVKSALSWSKSFLTKARSSSQCRTITLGLASSWSKGSTIWKSSMRLFKFLYASKALSRPGIFLHRKAKLSIAAVMSSMPATMAANCSRFHSFMFSLTSV